MCGPRGLTLIEVMIAMFVVLVGIVGVLAALPVGVNSAESVFLQDSAIHLIHSKFAEFRRDRVHPGVDLMDGSSYMTAFQEPLNTDPGGNWHDFASGPGATYENFEDIAFYAWKVEVVPVGNSGNAPVHAAGSPLPGLFKVTITVHTKGSKKEFRFTQYMFSCDA